MRSFNLLVSCFVLPRRNFGESPCGCAVFDLGSHAQSNYRAGEYSPVDIGESPSVSPDLSRGYRLVRHEVSRQPVARDSDCPLANLWPLCQYHFINSS
jgi:hypothetical protein